VPPSKGLGMAFSRRSPDLESLQPSEIYSVWVLVVRRVRAHISVTGNSAALTYGESNMANRSTARKAKTVAAKKAAVTKKPATVPGYPSIQLYSGPGVTDDYIAGVISANNGNSNVAITNDGKAHICDKHLAAGVTCKRGISWEGANRDFLAMQRREAEAAKHPAVMARGTDSRTAPHSAKAVADGRRAKAAAKPEKATKKAARKAARADKAAPKADDTRRISIVDRKFSYGGEGTARRACWDAAVKVAKAKGNVQAYIAAGGKAKYLPRWVSAGAIKLG
jgi:hypothetical protein